MKLIAPLVIVVIVILVGIQLLSLYRENRELVGDVGVLKEKADILIEESQILQNDIKYFSDSDNLEKELKSRFDYKRPGETLIKIQ
jgi:hypothetical protein